MPDRPGPGTTDSLVPSRHHPVTVGPGQAFGAHRTPGPDATQHLPATEPPGWFHHLPQRPPERPARPEHYVDYVWAG